MYLRRRVGSASRTLGFDAIGIAVYLLAIGAAVLATPIVRHSGLTSTDAVLNLGSAAADAASMGPTDGFRELTDTLGHEAANGVLRTVAERLGEVVPGMIGRLGADEFAAIVEDVDLLTVVAVIRSVLAAPVTLDVVAVSVRPVMGYARFRRTPPTRSNSPGALRSRAGIRKEARSTRPATTPSTTGIRCNASVWSPICGPPSRPTPGSGSRSSRSWRWAAARCAASKP
jgi:hypothetical protein